MFIHVCTVSLLLALVSTSGCAALQGNATRKLAGEELEYLKKLHQGVEDYGKQVKISLNALQEISKKHAADENSLALSVSKAKLLESMKSPWVAVPTRMAATQKAVALYHLYALAEADRDVLLAKLEERRAAVEAISDVYGRLETLLSEAIAHQELIFASLNQPPSARISAAVDVFLVEVKAFDEELAKSDNPKLKELAEKVTIAEEKATKVRDQIDKALELIQKQ